MQKTQNPNRISCCSSYSILKVLLHAIMLKDKKCLFIFQAFLIDVFARPKGRFERNYVNGGLPCHEIDEEG